MDWPGIEPGAIPVRGEHSTDELPAHTKTKNYMDIDP